MLLDLSKLSEEDLVREGRERLKTVSAIIQELRERGYETFVECKNDLEQKFQANITASKRIHL